MIYPRNFEEKIDFTRIRELVAGHCLSPLGEEKVRKMHFSDAHAEINTWLNRTREFMKILEEEDYFPTDHFIDVRTALKQLRVQGGWIEQQAMFDLRRSLQTIAEIVSFLQKDENETPKYPYLSAISEDVVTFPELIDKIDTLLDGFGQVKDNASPHLAEIRRETTRTMNSVSRNLQSILRNAQTEGFVDKNVTPVMRDGRLVIPVNPSHKRKIKGIVHDESASGKTVFIEPSELVEANNRIRELERDERREIVRILTAFTDKLRPFIPEIIHSYDFLAQIDFIRAKAKFAQQINGIQPAIEDCPEIDWVQAVHPLLFLSLRKQHREIVPLDIMLTDENRILLISGPNAGGKSVCLKTVGLLQYMLQCGLPIPLRENSKAGIFNDIFIDIGDEQSIENDLSTYSSHLINMKLFVKNCHNKSLILIDEFGSGTEPQIGAAIAEALLDRFNRKKSFGVITTHYQNLKHFANDNSGIVNGAMLYDRHLMQPLFQLDIGNPGSSFAVEIARKIGLSEDVIAQASEIVGSEYIHMDKYLQEIARDRRYWSRKRDDMRRQKKRLDELSEKYASDIDSIKQQKKEILLKAKSEAAQLLSESNAKIEQTIRTIRESQAEKEKTKQARQSLNEFRNKKTEKRKPKHTNQNTQLRTGNTVRIKGQTAVGEIIELQGKNALVAFGIAKTTVKINKLEPVSRNQLKKETRSQSTTHDLIHEKKINFKQEIDVRGMRGDEALQATMYFIDDAIQLGVPRIRILHGTGTGALRQIIRDYLRTVHGVARFRDEHVQFGGTGITIVDLE